MTSAQLSVGIIIISLGAGFLTYYFLSDAAKEKKKDYMGELLGQLMNFVIYMWVGKIVFNLSVFLKDPLSILSYPSNSTAFYVAVIASVITVTIKSERGKIDSIPFLHVFIFVFLIASFVYEFIQIVWNGNTYSLNYTALLAVLIILFVVVRDRITVYRLNILMFVSWSLGTLGVAFRMPFTMVFGYTISPGFLVLFLVACLLLVLYKRRKVS